jgi:hypothetical protein
MGIEEPSNFVTTKGIIKDKNNKANFFSIPSMKLVSKVMKPI